MTRVLVACLISGAGVDPFIGTQTSYRRATRERSRRVELSGSKIRDHDSETSRQDRRRDEGDAASPERDLRNQKIHAVYEHDRISTAAWLSVQRIMECHENGTR